MILKNAELLDANFNRIKADLLLYENKISEIGPDLAGEDQVYDLKDCLIVPGFVDIHIHGCLGRDTCDANRESLGCMASHLLTHGVTSFCPTTMTVSQQQIAAAIATVRECMDKFPEGAAICGVNMEGPYISPNKKGAQQAEYIRVPDWQEFERLFRDCGGIIKLVEIAPECENADSFIAHVSKLCTVSLAHSEAGYEQAKAAFRQGITHVTHLFNAMTGCTHRMPGAVGAVFDETSVRAEIICDGLHIHPAILRMAFCLLGEDRTVIISDSMRAADLPDGVSELGGQKVYVRDGQARLTDGTLAGSTTNIHQEIKNLLKFGIPLKQVIKSATINPATAIGENQRIGSVELGKDADLVVFDKEFNIKLVIAKGMVKVNRI